MILDNLERMGNRGLRPLRSRGEVTILSNVVTDSGHVEFDPRKTFLLAYGIDKHDPQPDPQFKPLKDVTLAKSDARSVCDAFVKAGVLPRENVRCYIASGHRDKCTLAGMKDGITEVGQETDLEGGLFVLYYAGHGIKPPKSKDFGDWILGTVDLNKKDESTYLTAKTRVGASQPAKRRPFCAFWIAVIPTQWLKI